MVGDTREEIRAAVGSGAGFGVHETIRWYMDNEKWWRKIREDAPHKRFSERWYAEITVRKPTPVQ